MNRMYALAVGLVIAGTWQQSRAAGPMAAVEAESAALAGGAVVEGDPNASGGQAVRLPSVTGYPSRSYGFHMDLTYDGNATHRQAVVNTVKSLGAQISRNSLLWAEIEPTQGLRDWSRTDAVVNELEAAGIETLFVIYGSPAWINGSGDPFVVPTDPAAFNAWVAAYTNFIRAAVDRYRGRVKKWEIGNEPNEYYFWKPDRNYAQYLQWYEAMVAAMRQEDPAAQLAVGGITGLYVGCCAPYGNEWISQLIDDGAPVDYIGIHTYPDHAPDVHEDYEPNFDDIEGIHTLLVAKGSPATLWVTEWGWPTAGSFSNTVQAQFIKRSFEILRDNYTYVGLATYFLDYDRTLSADKYYHGVLYDDLAPKPSAAEVAAFMQTVPAGNSTSAGVTVNVPEAGSYRIWSRIQAPDGVNNSYTLQVDGGGGITVADAALPAGAWTWVDFRDNAPASKITVSLSAGPHTLTLLGREPNVKIDRLLLLSDPSAVPLGTGGNCEPPVSVPFRMNCGGGAYTDAGGRLWQADAYYTMDPVFGPNGGGVSSTAAAISGTSDPTLYQSERWGIQSYAIPVSTGAYEVRLHFAEINPASGRRVFNVTLEEQAFLTDYCIEDQAGNYTAAIKITDLTVPDAVLDIGFVTGSNAAKISALEVLPFTPPAGTPTATPSPSPPASTSTPTPTRTPVPAANAPTLTPVRTSGAYESAVPNPFRPGRGQTVGFHFALIEQQATYRIRIMTVKGRVVRTLHDSRQWDGRDDSGRRCEGGIYIYQIDAGGARVSGTVLLVAE
jgi:hypothetical protein